MSSSRARSQRYGGTRLVGAGVVGLALVVGLSGCQPGTAAGTAAPAATASAAPAVITVEGTEVAGSVRPDQPLVVTAAGGALTEVAVTTPEGAPVAGALGEGGQRWTSTDPLAPATRYAVHAVARNAAGASATRDAEVATLTPATTAFPAVAPLSGSTVGVGMPIIVTLDEPVAEDRRAAVEEQLRVSTDPQGVVGAWSWQSATKVEFRPENYWPAHTKVHVDLDLGSVEVSPGVWGTTRDIDFTVGSAMVSHVDIAAHTLTVTEDGTVLRTIPVTLGQSGSGGRYVTRSGTKVIMSLEKSRQMDAETTGVSKDDPNYYNVAVKYAMRLTNSGEFLHAAPWSVGSQGRANVSHGCTGMSTADAQWMFAHSKVGDVVTYSGSDRAIEAGNGFDVWNESFADWKGGSALPS
ncbi:Ig-like domain-containing protein [Kineococcus gynurae]|uniref:Ig-like domain-containing protein n=1 Tax=Kineococcus gynurae TaxID=452979 RepID=A0ABV5LUF7_9ACTN